jgi:SAM-dependent methyltransferase
MNENSSENNWFASWFDSPFYHKLYANRDLIEAELFIQNLVNYLDLKHNERVLDLACGKGRHAFFLSKFGLNVTGLDLAPNSISEAQLNFVNDALKFDVHDMREVYKNEKFDFIFNLFTSFGYFDQESDNLKVLNSIYEMLSSKGTLVIDFMNAQKVTQELVFEETKIMDGTVFNIKRSYSGKHIFKQINFEDKEEEYSYTERVQALFLNDFRNLLEEANFELIESFGDYNMNKFDENNSPRLILIAKKR